MFCVQNVVKLLVNHFGCSSTDFQPSREEQKMYDSLRQMLENACLSNFDVFEAEEEFVQNSEEEKSDPTWTGDDLNDNPTYCDTIQNGVRFTHGVYVPTEQVDAALRYYRSSKKGSRPLKTISNQFRFVKCDNDLKILRKYEKNEGVIVARREKLQILRNRLHVAVTENILAENGLSDNSLQNIALDISKEIGLSNFNASLTWIKQFKQFAGMTIPQMSFSSPQSGT